MKYPTTVKVLGKQWKILPKCPTDDAMGEAFHQRLELWINPAYPIAHQRDTVLHELNHAIDKEASLGFTEKQINLYSTILLATLRDNPALVAFLTGKDGRALL